MTQLLHTHVILYLMATPPDVGDTTGVNTALYSLARMLASFVGGALAIGLVIEGYQYMFSDSASRGVHLKRSLVLLIGGAMLVILGVFLAPLIVGVVQPPK